MQILPFPPPLRLKLWRPIHYPPTSPLNGGRKLEESFSFLLRENAFCSGERCKKIDGDYNVILFKTLDYVPF